MSFAHLRLVLFTCSFVALLGGWAVNADATCTAYAYDPASDSVISRTNTGNAHYIDFSTGVDSSSGASTSVPWKHHPYMRGWSGSYNHTVGDCFYFKGGVTWDNSNWQVTLANGGSAGNEDYYGPDPAHSWFAGSSWTRPMFDFGGAPTPSGQSAILSYQSDYIIIDNLEFVRLYCDAGHSSIAFSTNAHIGLHMIRNYIHQFSAVSSSGCGSSHEITVAASGGAPSNTGYFSFNVVNGSDGTAGIGGYVVEALRDNLYNLTVSHNVIHDVCSAVNISGMHEVTFNLIYNVGPWPGAPFDCSASANGGYHPDGIQLDTWGDIHDNVLFHVTGEVINVVPGSTPSYVYNNVFYANVPIAILIGNVGSQASGDVSIFNNTFECSSLVAGNPCIRVGSSSVTGTIAVLNNHYVTASGTASGSICINSAPFFNSACGGATVFTYSANSELYQTMSQANSAGYNSNQAFAYSPTSSTSPTTVVTGSNLSTKCSSVPSLCVDTGYGTISSGNYATLARVQVLRSTTWHPGAYQSSATSGTNASLNPPTSLVATVN